MDVKHTKTTEASVNDAIFVSSLFEAHEVCFQVRCEDTAFIGQPNTLADLDPKTRALIRPYMTIDVLLRGMNGTSTLLKKGLLLDSGSLDGSYVGSGVLKDNRDIVLKEKACNGTVYMADDKSRVAISRKVLLDLQVESLDRTVHHVRAWFAVLGNSPKLILGYPQLVQLPTSFFYERYQKACDTLADSIALHPHGRDTLKDVILEEYSNGSEFDYVEGETYPAWERPDEPPPEEFLDLQDEHAVHFMEQDPDEALQQYLHDLEKYRDLPPPEPGEERTAPLGLFSKRKDYLEYMRTVGRKVFVPQNWEGIKVSPISLEVGDQLPRARYARGRPPPKKLEAQAVSEIKRLLRYMYVPSKSPWMSDNVWAAKATAPFVRSCGDYRWINEHIRMRHAYIPDVREELAKLKDFKYFCDFDLTNAFHQFRLDDKTSELLSIMTISGPIRPLFMPEGISPASAILQTHVREIFKDFADDSLIMFDNLTIGAHTLDELFAKQKKFFNKCIEYNIFLKFTKSYFGVQSIKFFGYIADGHGYHFEESRIKALMDIEFPHQGTVTQRRTHMQMFLGTANFISPCYVHTALGKKPDKDNPLWADLIGPLADTTHKDFPWADESKWKRDYRADMNRLKTYLNKVTQLYYPDYNLPWILRTDASQNGVGAILFQIRQKEGVEIPEPIATVAHKFSEAATNWETIKQEGFAIFYAVKKLSHYLSGKKFLIETDHRNLVYMERSEVAILIRWRLYLQQFRFRIRHIEGKKNIAADTFSRLFPEAGNEDNPQEKTETLLLAHTQEELKELAEASPLIPTKKARRPRQIYTQNIPEYDKLIQQVHGGDELHLGQRYTWRKLAMLHPGHRIPQSYIEHYVRECPVCQKLREEQIPDTYKPMERTLHVKDPRQRIGIDAIYNPEDRNGNSKAHVIVNNFTKLVFIYPCKELTAESAARAILRYRTLYGPIAEIAHDRGSDYTADINKHLCQWLGLKNRVALTDVHTSTGVEPVNKQIKRHVEALMLDCYERGYNWSDPEVIDLVAFAMNEIPRDTTGGHSAYEMTFGDISQLTGEDISSNDYVKRLQDNLAKIREKILELHRQEIQRVENQPNQNQWQPTDLVFLRNNAQYNHGRRWLGPYQVLAQSKNDVTIGSLLDEDVKQTVHVDRLRAYHGEYNKAVELSRMEQGEHAIKQITHYYGNPMDRGTLGFNVEFEDGTVVEKTYSDIKKTVALANLIKRHKELLPLTTETLKAQAELKKRIKRTDIAEKYRDAKEVYIDVRCQAIFPYVWYAKHFETLPDANTHRYLIKATPTGKQTKRNITVSLQADKGFLTRGKLVPLDNWDYCTYVYTQEELEGQEHTIITQPPSRENSGLTTDGVYHRQITPLEYDKPNMFTVLLLNVCSLRAAWKKGLLDYLIATPHDILVLTETRLPTGKKRSRPSTISVTEPLGEPQPRQREIHPES